tara:strand:+ start:11484 stop:12182 length:699 start_codon:yes stop_codon:yes gene_type:complete
MKNEITMIADTHGFMPDDIDPTKLLIHAGDITGDGSMLELRLMCEWMSRQPADHVVAVAGNHDISVERFNQGARKIFKEYGITYLQNEWAEVAGYKIYGTPMSLNFGNWSFMGTEEELKDIFKRVPDDCDIVISHGPPHGVLDLVPRGENTGSRAALFELICRVGPRLFVCGHIHEQHGVLKLDMGTACINASVGPYSEIKNGRRALKRGPVRTLPEGWYDLLYPKNNEEEE